MQTFTYQKIELSDTEFMNQIYRLRFQVYAKECGFIKEEDYPDGLEIDGYDKQSVHFGVLNQDGDIIATMRMIFSGKLPLPVEKYCPTIDKDLIAKHQAVEISRLVISKKLRRRKNDALYYEPNLADEKADSQEDMSPGQFLRRANPMIFGLYREMYRESKSKGITHWYTLMETSLWALLQLHGFSFTCVGEEVDIYGPVKPYVAEITKIEGEVLGKYPKLFDYFMEDLDKHISKMTPQQS